MKHAKIFTLLCVSSMIICSVSAQNSNDPISIYVSGGISVPVGQFASQTRSDNTSAFAKIGTDRRFGITYRFSRYIGISFLAGLMINPYSESSQNPEPGKQILTEKSYGTRRLMAGPTFTHPLGHSQKWDISASLLAGGMAWQDFVSETLGSDTIGLYKANRGNAFAYQAGVKVQYRFAHHWQASLGADFLGATFTVANELITGVPQSRSIVPPSNKLPVRTVNTSLGIAFLL